MLATAPDDEILAEMLALQSELAQQVCKTLMERAFCSVCTTQCFVSEEKFADCGEHFASQVAVNRSRLDVVIERLLPDIERQKEATEQQDRDIEFAKAYFSVC